MKLTIQLILGAVLCVLFPNLSFSNTPPPTQINSVTTGTNYSYPVSPSAGSLMEWSDPASWVGGVVPGAGAEVTIPSGSAILIDQNIEVQGIRVHGQLVVDPNLTQVDIKTEYILISGSNALFEWGTETAPFNGTGTLTLVGQNPSTIPGVTSIPAQNSKGIMAMMGGTLHIHGLYKDSWTQLNQTAFEGSYEIQVAQTIDGWHVGDSIAIASSATYDFEQMPFNSDDGHLQEAEVHEIAGVTPIGNDVIIELVDQLEYNHFGEIQSYSNGNRSWELDQRTEVGVLTRNIKIQGDLSSETTHHGGHIMIMLNSYGYVSGVELTRMGQESLKARYPFHWHLAKDVTGQYIKNCSLHHLYFRAVTVHGSQNAVVNDNVVFETQGHAMFFEDAVESGVTMDHNLVMNVRRPPNGVGPNSFIGSDRGNVNIRLRGPGAFWITNPDNTITNNHVAGVQGTGFWYGMPTGPTGPSANDPSYNGLQPDRIAIKKFDNNCAHGAMTGFHQDHANNDNSSSGVGGGNYFVSSAMGWQSVTNFTAYHCFRGWWTRTIGLGIDFRETVMADCPGQGMSVTSFEGRTTNSLFVGHSANAPFGSTHFPNQAISLYDGYIAAYECHFADFDWTEQSVFAMIGGRGNRTNNVFTGCTFSPNSKLYDPSQIPVRSVRLMSVAHDKDGVFTQPWGAVCVYHPFFVDDVHFSQQGNAKSYKTNEHFAALRIYHNYSLYYPPPSTNPDAGTQYMEWGDGHCIHLDERLQQKSQMAVVPNIGRIYKLRMIDGVPSPLDLHLKYARNGDVFDLQILDSPDALSVSTSGYVAKSSESQVWSSATNAYYWNPATHVLSIRMKPTGGGIGTETTLTATSNVQVTGGTKSALLARPSRPFGGTPRSENTKVEAEWYDYGGQNVAYYKAIPQGLNHYINQVPDPVDKKLNRRELQHGRLGEMLRLYKSPGGDLAVKDLDDGDYVNYTFYSPKGFSHDLMLHYAWRNGGEIEVYVNGKPSWTAPQILSSTGSNTTFTTVLLPAVTLQPGYNVVQIRPYTDDFSMDWFSIGAPDPIAPPAPVCKKSLSTTAELDVELEETIQVYPNPVVGDYVTVELSQVGAQDEVQLLDPLGKVCWTGHAEKSMRVEIPAESGVYLLKIQSELQGELTYRIIR
ncbi:T9SS type A sorting domain-containing protein [bacterium SCSIO 12741]|nr:T9SS type A sorting domain-containing protein [bacterium SCSIO 12741]